MRAFTVLEYRAIPRGDGPDCIPDHLADRLVAAARTSIFAGRGEGGVLENRRHDLRARGVVGVIAAEGVSLEILPKIDTPAPDGSDEARGQIRQRLVHMLAVALDVTIETGRLTDLHWQKNTLLDILIRVFCDKLTEALRRGMPRRYVAQEDDLPALRGTLDVTRQFTRHAVNPSRLACRFDELSPDIALNRIMKAAVAHLSRLSRSPANQQRLRELSFLYADVTPVPVPSLAWDQVVIDRTNRYWQELLDMARLFLGNRFQTTSTGASHGSALLFEMNKLFEEYVGRLLSRALKGCTYRVSLQGGRLHCLTNTTNGRDLFQTKPDILIRDGSGKVVQVIDTKWKRMSATIDDPKQGVSQADIYQMMAYAHLYHAPHMTLIYPHHAGLTQPEGVQSTYRIKNGTTHLRTASLDVSRGLDRDIQGRLEDLVLSAAPDPCPASF